MTTAHTPGPWIAVSDTLVRGPHGEPIASTKGMAFPHDPNFSANARLIAAAPETAAERDRLKATNAELLAAVEWLIDQVAEPIDPNSDWGRRHAQARAAIRAAKGE